MIFVKNQIILSVYHVIGRGGGGGRCEETERV